MHIVFNDKFAIKASNRTKENQPWKWMRVEKRKMNNGKTERERANERSNESIRKIICSMQQHIKLRNQIIFTLFRLVNAISSPSIVDCWLSVDGRWCFFPFLLFASGVYCIREYQAHEYIRSDVWLYRSTLSPCVQIPSSISSTCSNNVRC